MAKKSAKSGKTRRTVKKAASSTARKDKVPERPVRTDTKTRMLKNSDIPNRMPVMPLLSLVVFPYNVVSFIVRKPHNIQMLEEVGDTERIMCLVGQRDMELEKPRTRDDLYPIGVAARLIYRMNLPDGTIQVTFQGLRRVKVDAIVQTDPYMRMQVSEVDDKPITQNEIEVSAMMASALELFEHIVAASDAYSNELVAIMKSNLHGPSRFCDMIATFVSFPLHVKNELLEELDPVARLRRLIEHLQVEVQKTQLEEDVQKRVRVEIEKNQREYLLREQLKAIRKELGDTNSEEAEVEVLRERLEAAKLPEAPRKAAMDELKRLSMVGGSSSEYSVIRNYLEWLISLPWHKASEDRLELARAREVISRGHYGLDEVKDRIIEFLAVLKLRGDAHGSIVCLVGPPGVGKTSIGKAMAEAMGRQFQRISVGGLRDDSEIMGHRRTYVGAMPGRIIEAMKRAATVNPLIMIDEIDKMGADVRGDPASAMLEVLDPEQNAAFTDRYVDLPYDLSKVLFICTANSTSTIPRPLLDRMEVISLSGYTRMEKFEIAKRYLIDRQLKASGLKQAQIHFEDAALYAIIDRYTREAGVRNLERTVGTTCRKVAVKVLEGHAQSVTVTAETLEELLGPQLIYPDPRQTEAEVGVATGLAWTPVGGAVLFIEAIRYQGKGGVTITGSLGEVMKESVQAAMSYVRSHASELGIDQQVLESSDIHVHFPEGAMPKDGPSAGVTIVTALTSLLSERPVRPDVAMTGEVTLRGKVLAVGGIKEKVLGAHQVGITRIIIPKANEHDLAKVPDEVKRDIHFVLSDDVRTNLKEALLDIVVPRDGMNSKIIQDDMARKNHGTADRKPVL